jgi:Major Facilitator Superfamily
MTAQTIIALGVGQCVNWGILYYAFSVLLTPLQRDLGVPNWVPASAFSLALLTSALAAPTVGRWSDQGAGLRLIHNGGYIASCLMLAWAAIPGLPSLFVVWAALGVCMAATLYEPVFVTVGRTIREPEARLRAFATVTVLGGLASTIFLPLTAFLVESQGWRAAVMTLAATLALSTFVSSRIHSQPVSPTLENSRQLELSPATSGPPIFAMLGLFSAASLVTTAFTTTLVPALIARDVPPLSAAWLGGLLGLMQLPGRVLVMRGSLNTSASRLLVVSLVAQAIGIGTIAMSNTLPLHAIGVATFAMGAGLTTLARPHLVQTIFEIEHTGYINGRVASAQSLARAGGPVLAVGLAGVIGYGPTFGVLAGAVAALAAACPFMIEA